MTTPEEGAAEFTRGYVCAVANLIRLHDQPEMARDLLREILPVDWRTIAEYDRAVLRKEGLTS
jgi:hypothetical protein